LDSKTDAELVALARTGDKVAFGALVERYQLMAKRAAMRMVAHEDIAQELAQEAMLRAYLALSKLRDDQNFRNWLYGIVLNVCRAYLRDHKTAFFTIDGLADNLITEDSILDSAENNPEKIVEEKEVQRRVLETIHDLSTKNKWAVMMFYYDQLSLQEIAESLGISVVAVKGRLHKARQHLRIELSSTYFDQIGTRKENAMIKVTIGDVVWMKLEDRSQCVILLLDKVRQRALPIWVSSNEAEPIARGIHNITSPRPLTFNFMANLLKASNAHLEEVRVQTLKDEIFYAVAKVRNGSKTQEIDTRPSDALSLAVLTGSPMFVSPEIPEEAWIGITQEDGDKPRPIKDVEAIMGEIRSILENQVHPKQFLSASLLGQEETRNAYLKSIGFPSEAE
jgi:RNA polymerase sigma factor (sigma-70 family)